MLRQLPKVDVALADPRLAEVPRAVAVWALREVLDEVRAAVRGGTLLALPDVIGLARRRAELALHGHVRPVINATGVVVHTNLGRAPWPEEAMAAATLAAGYASVELDLDSGARGGRMSGIEAALRMLTGCEAALVVNNCAAAVLLALTALARDRDVVVSRGELVEIGGSFRVPEVIASGGARLVEVGTTNRTRISDYAGAIDDRTAVLLKVHLSNFRQVGFVEETPREALVALADERGLTMVEDLGSGALDTAGGEPGVRDAVRAGVHVALFSGDKLLGGPQAGIAVGRAEVIARLRRHPLYRALRVDKTILAALEATLAVHAAGRATPVGRMIAATPETLAPRADALAEALAAHGIEVRRERDEGRVGGGSRPEEALLSEVVAVVHPDPNELARRLRTGLPAIVARVAHDTLRLDVRTMAEHDLQVVADRVAEAMHEG